MSTRWFPRPLLSLLLAIVWLLLVQDLGLVHWLAAALVGFVVPHLVRRFLVDPVLPRRPVVAARFALLVLYDIAVANVVVARIVLSPGARPKPAWVPVELALRDPHAIAVLASVITLTPGTVSCVVDEERWLIHVHALDCADPQALAAEIRARYERPLLEIFEP